MPSGTPQTALEAVTWRRLLISSWPWRSAGYLLATLPVAVMAAAGLAIPAVPWLMQVAGGYQAGVIVLLILAGGALIAALGPLIAIPVTSLARRRLRLVDRRHVPRETAPAAGPGAWLRTRYADPAAWREAGYACLLATVVPALCAAVLGSVGLSGMLIVSPLLLLAQQPGSAPVALGVGHAATVGQASPT